MSTYTEFIPELYTEHNVIIPKIYTNGKFLPIHIYIAGSDFGELYTIDGNFLAESNGLLLAAKDSTSSYVMNK